MTKPTGRRTGRPIREAVPGARVSLGLKVVPEIKSKLDQASRLTGRTQSAEAEYRLQLSFEAEDVVRQALMLAYGETIARAMFVFADSARMAQTTMELHEKGMVSDANKKMMIEATRKGLTGLIETVIKDIAK